MQYLVSDSLNGEPSNLDGNEVDSEFVRLYTDVEVCGFLVSLSRTGELRKTKTGIITVKSVNPDGTEVRQVKFTPVSRNGVA